MGLNYKGGEESSGGDPQHEAWVMACPL